MLSGSALVRSRAVCRGLVVSMMAYCGLAVIQRWRRRPCGDGSRSKGLAVWLIAARTEGEQP